MSDPMNPIQGLTKQALSNAYHNAVKQQQDMDDLLQSSINTVETLLGVDSADEPELSPEELLQVLHYQLHNVEMAMPPTTVTVPSIPEASDDFASSVRSIAEAFAASLDAINAAKINHTRRILQLAAASAVLKAMTAQPEKAASYEEALAVIQKIA